jgi:hypothetical protein
MPITSNTLEQTTQANGGTSNIVRLYDQDAREYMQSFFAPANYDVQGRINSMIAEMNEQLAQNEFEALVGAE